MSTYILILNCGSSSVKFSVMNPENGDEPFKGIAERLAGGNDGSITFKTEHGKREILIPASHQAALEAIVSGLKEEGLFEQIKAIGHRVVHGGEYFSQSVVIDEKVVEKIQECIALAPLHNPAHILGIKAAQSAFPHLKQVAVFDTAFHQQIPEEAYLYPLPYHLYEQHKIRRYGFHGTSYRYIAGQLPNLLGQEKVKSIVCHLGNGGSIAALDHDHSRDTTMGLTPLEGLVHGTRSGDIDPALFQIIANQTGKALSEIDAMLWKESGLLGLSSGLSNDCRVLEEAMQNGNTAATRAITVYAYRLAKHIAAQMVAIGGADCLVFTGGIGENSPIIRGLTLEKLAFLGFTLDKALNDATFRGKQGAIHAAGSKPIWVIPTNEELMIAKDTAALS
ncbi:MAG: acetate kinase [Cardiobacteriaceae bacterium]|nr:acetate kinase [Cardiobacteriaceae bacterium]